MRWANRCDEISELNINFDEVNLCVGWRGQTWGQWNLFQDKIPAFQDAIRPGEQHLDLLRLASWSVKEIRAFELELIPSHFTMGDLQHVDECSVLHELTHLGLPGSATQEILRPVV